jgi:hypothetical protein
MTIIRQNVDSSRCKKPQPAAAHVFNKPVTAWFAEWRAKKAASAKSKTPEQIADGKDIPGASGDIRSAGHSQSHIGGL